MKPFDQARFQNAFEKPPKAFHDTLKQALGSIASVEEPLLFRRKVILFAVMAACLIGVAAAVITHTTLDDFFGLKLTELGIPITSEFTVEGNDMALVDVRVKEAASDGIFMYLTVEFSLKDQKGKVLLYDSDINYLRDNTIVLSPYSNLDVSQAQSAQTVYWMRTDSVTCRDSQGIAREVMYDMHRYDSPSTVVVMYWFDLRAEDAYAFDAPAEGYPDMLAISITPALYIYQENAKVVALDGHLGDVPNSGDYLACAEAGKLLITASPQRKAAQTYHIANFPNRFYELRVVNATVTDTPLAYYLRLDFQRTEDCTYVDYSMYPELFDENGQEIPFFIFSRAMLGEGGEPVDNRLEAIYIKQDERKAHSLRVSPLWDEETNSPIMVALELTPVE